MYSTLSCGSTCVKVFQLLWGKNRDDYSQAEKEEKTNTGNMAMNRTLLELELSCPAGTSGTAVTPRGHQMEPDTTTAVYKSRQAGRRWLGKHLRWEMRLWTVMLYNAMGQFTVQSLFFELTVCLLLIWPFLFCLTNFRWLGVQQVFNIHFISLLVALIYRDVREEKDVREGQQLSNLFELRHALIFCKSRNSLTDSQHIWLQSFIFLNNAWQKKHEGIHWCWNVFLSGLASSRL